MPAPTIDFIKAWCRIDGPDFDLILPALIAGAVASAGHETGRDYTVEAMPEPVALWCSAQIAHWLASPEAASESALHANPFFGGLLDPYRRHVMEEKPA